MDRLVELYHSSAPFFVIPMRDTQLYEHRDLRAIFIREDVIPVPRHWDPVFHAISQRHLFEYKTATFTLTSSVCFYNKISGCQCHALA
ncbi:MULTISPECIES: hypothetical protein [unclassified Wolbachia]|uniref:hypothetical protein n=1 Tax=unclassified Wolbachia TaxID=2640676 RepID=UPI0012E97B30|nr:MULTISPECIES: hypothetical protein [unclassified Wolbachia]